MKRLAASLFGSSTVPLTVLFVLTAGPARLYAESAVPVAACETLVHTEACAGLDAGAACTYDAGTGACFTAVCRESDASYTSALQCFGPVVTPVPTDDAGDAAADAAADAIVDAAADAIGEPPTRGATEGGPDTEDAATTPAAGDATTPASSNAASHDDGGCSMPAGSPAGSTGTFFGALVAACAVWRLRRRAA